MSTEFNVCASCGSAITDGGLVCSRCDDEDHDDVSIERTERTTESHGRAAKVLTVLSAMTGLGWPVLGIVLAGYAVYRLKSLPEPAASERRWKVAATFFVLLWFFVSALNFYQHRFPPAP